MNRNLFAFLPATPCRRFVENVVDVERVQLSINVNEVTKLVLLVRMIHVDFGRRFFIRFHQRRVADEHLGAQFALGSWAVVAFLLKSIDDDTRKKFVRFKVFESRRVKCVGYRAAMAQYPYALAACHVPHSGTIVIGT